MSGQHFGRPSSMGQDQSALAKQSRNISAARSRADSNNEIQSPPMNYHPHRDSRDRGRSPTSGHSRNSSFSQNGHAQPSEHGFRNSNNRGHYPSPGSARHRFVRDVRENDTPSFARQRSSIDERAPQSPNRDGTAYRQAFARGDERPNSADRRSSVDERSPQSPNRNGTAHRQAFARGNERPHPGDRHSSISDRSPRSPNGNESTRRQSFNREAKRPNFAETRSPNGTERYSRQYDLFDPRVRTSTKRPRDDRWSETRRSIGKMDFNGLKDVPLAPRSSLGNIDPLDSTRAPHIFISSNSLPTQQHLSKHLNGMLGLSRPVMTKVDDSGWYLVYEDSNAGRQKLKQCFGGFHMKKLFGMYKLSMICYPDGREAGIQRQRNNSFDSRNRPLASIESQSGAHHLVPDTIPPSVRRFEEREIDYPPSLKVNDSAKGMTASVSGEPTKSRARPNVQETGSPFTRRSGNREIIYPAPLGKSGPTKSITAPNQGGRTTSKAPPSDQAQSTPSQTQPEAVHSQNPAPSATMGSRLHPRSDRDDTASMASGVTSSDASRGKPPRCRTCKGEASYGFSPLVSCSTCTNKYHRRCHNSSKAPPIPPDLSDDHDWSCYRCLEKSKDPKGQTDALKPPSSALSAHNDRDGQRGRSDEAATPAPARATARSQSIAQNDTMRSEPGNSVKPLVSQTDTMTKLDAGSKAQRESEPLADAVTKANAGSKPQAGSELLSDADDLVEKSFALAEKKKQSELAAPQKPGKPKLIRTKMPPPPPKAPAGETSGGEATDENIRRTAEAPRTKTSSGAQASNGGAMRSSAAGSNTTSQARENSQDTTGPSISLTAVIPASRPASTPNAFPSGDHNSPGPNTNHDPSNLFTPKPFVMGPQSVSCDDCRRNHLLCKHISSLSGDQREIPESPEDVRHGVTDDRSVVQRMKGVTQGPQPSASHSPAPESSVGRDRSESTDRASVKKPSALKASRGPSLGGGVFSPCEGCHKPIRQGPSRNRKLCSSCREAAEAAGAGDEATAQVDNIGDATTAQTVGTEDATTAQAAGAGDATTAQATGKFADVAKMTDGVSEARKKSEDANTAAQQVAPSKNTIESRDVSDRDNAAPTKSLPHGKGTDEDRATVAQNSNDTTTELVSAMPNELPQAHPAVTNPTSARGDSSPLDNAPKASMPTDRNLSANAPDPVENTTAASAQKLEHIKAILGDSFSRPTGARKKLVGMALSNAPERRVQAEDIVKWIDENIPTYQLGNGNWRTRVISELSQDSIRNSRSGDWREEDWEDGDGGLPGKKWYRLLPEKEDTTWKWCPVLKEPLSPLQSAHKATQPKKKNSSHSGDASKLSLSTGLTAALEMPASGTPNPQSRGVGIPGATGGNLASMSSASEAVEDAMDVDEMSNPADEPQRRRQGRRKRILSLPTVNASSSDEEPLAKKQRRSDGSLSVHAGRAAAQQHTPANTEMGDLLSASSEYLNTQVVEARRPDANGGQTSDSSARANRPGLVILKTSRKSSTSDDFVEPDEPHDRITTAKAFYEEYPEYRPEVDSEEEAKLAEIRKRPTRKQMFGKPASRSRVNPQGPISAPPSMVPTNASPEKRSRSFVDAAPKDPFPWENPDVDPTRKKYKTLDEFFDIPDNVIPIISDGQLAYRDGTRAADGSLPRAREVYKP